MMSVPGHLGARVLTLKWGQTRLSAGGPTVSGDLGLLQGLPLPPPTPSLQTLQQNSLLVSLSGVFNWYSRQFFKALYIRISMGLEYAKIPHIFTVQPGPNPKTSFSSLFFNPHHCLKSYSNSNTMSTGLVLILERHQQLQEVFLSRDLTLKSN